MNATDRCRRSSAVRLSVNGLLWVLLAVCVQAHAAERGPTRDDATARCAAMVEGDYSRLPDAPTQITGARVVAAASGLPALCELQGYVVPNTGIQLRLPLSGWNGKFFYAGCGGSCGTFDTEKCDYPLVRGYACIVSDIGHRSGGGDGLWAFHNLDAKVDFGFRATHRTAVAGKAITQLFYGAVPKYSYFMGCSTGGRQALVSAQRFPWDFNGIIAGGAVISEAGTAMDFLWNLNRVVARKGGPLFTVQELKALHAAVVAANDMNDGVRDGLIGDPRRSKFDPATLQCRDGLRSECLSAEQVDAVRKIYAGPMNSRGEKLYSGGGMQPGSELSWAGFLTPAGGRSGEDLSASDTTRFMLSDWGASWTFKDFNFDADYKRMGEMDALYSASNPDLRAFKAAGGKLLVYQGWSDPMVVPLNSVDYYESVERTMGGRQTTQAFMRLFMVPGMDHCSGGEGAFAIDYIEYLEAWVEQNRAPDVLNAAHLSGVNTSASIGRRYPVDPATVSFRRPVYPYPLQVRYKGRGDPNDAASFEAVDPSVAGQ